MKKMCTSKKCAGCGQNFEVTDQDRAFYEQMKVPEPRTCPDCRLQRRLLERNARKLYKRKCDFSGDTILSQYHADHPFPVYEASVWWGDKWDGLDYGHDYDPSRSFFKQFKELKNRTPHMALYVILGTMTNSDYVNCAGYLKNCYLCFEADHNEDCYYSNRIYHSKDLVDCFNCYKSEVCFECSDCQNCYNLKYSQDCEHCTDSYFLKDCKSCEYCIACQNLRHKKHCILNKQYSPQDYEIEAAKYDLKTLEGLRELGGEAHEFFITQPNKHLKEEHNENSLGDYLYHSKNSAYCFDCRDLEDCKYCARVSMTVKSAMDYTAWGDQAELMYQCAACGDNAYNLKFCSNCTTNNVDLEYCHQCTGCQNCFGCSGLKRKKYCILNKQYSKEEYFSLRDRIIKDMQDDYGEFFPLDICQYGYNETLAPEYFPLTKEEALGKGFKWAEE